MTLGNTKSVDILMTDPRTGRMFKIEVKTHYRNTPTHSKLFGHTLGWIMSQKHEEIIDPTLFYVFVNIANDTGLFRYFIVPSGVVARYVKEQHEYWLKTGEAQKTVIDTSMRKFRVGIDNEGYSIQTPLARDYENMWSLLE
ncbi:MAG TPA: hypothetical protein VG965_04480 [Patescibacteria group bacterium]|nr:hypothetical protein [Patescibacteria group bacterium]